MFVTRRGPACQQSEQLKKQAFLLHKEVNRARDEASLASPLFVFFSRASGIIRAARAQYFFCSKQKQQKALPQCQQHQYQAEELWRARRETGDTAICFLFFL
jgi:hypothetical protein